MKRKLPAKGTPTYNRMYPKWTPERKVKFQATMAKKYGSKRKPRVHNVNFDLETVPLNTGKSFGIGKSPEMLKHISQEASGLIRFKEHFIGMFEAMDKSHQKEVLCELVKLV